ncbi:hypothetical protein [Nitrospina watsonii]|uniref:Type II secretion system protein GspC N-terminal domain-containing protein n=1 Tax=Nitrospina watsonii TaxID=1323948 RepID=A0ABM9HCK5_9BACT|nr:hypothetical protein [Nitrospina watsonii]CAI2717816.1 conserved protein of unknown function [Nitrospina watsonii]
MVETQGRPPKPERRSYFEEEEAPPPPAPIWQTPKAPKGMGWLIFWTLLAGFALMFWVTREEPLELKPIVVKLYSEPGRKPQAALQDQKEKPPSLPEDWQQRFEPKLRSYPGEDRAVQTQAGHQRVPRYEFLPQLLMSSPRKTVTVPENRSVLPTPPIRGKELVLAGRGYEIGRFEPDRGLGFRLNTLPLPEAQAVPLEQLPAYGNELPREDEKNARKLMILHAGATGVPPAVTLEASDEMKPPPELEMQDADAEPLPETRLVLGTGRETLLLLTPSQEKPVDLLNGNPAINRHEFEKRETRRK